MAYFYASIKGGRGEATRTGTKASGIEGHVRGWHHGVRVKGQHFRNQLGELDSFQIYMTGGSSGKLKDVYLGEVILDESGEPVFKLAEIWQNR